MNQLWTRVENSKQLEPLPRKAAMTQNLQDQHLAAAQNGLKQSSMEWSVEISNTAMWSGMGVFVVMICAFVAVLIRKNNGARKFDARGQADSTNYEKDQFLSA